MKANTFELFDEVTLRPEYFPWSIISDGEPYCVIKKYIVELGEQDDRVYSKKVIMCQKIDYLIEQLDEFGPHTNPKNKQAAHHEMCVANLKAARRCITNDLFENYLTELNLPK